jgi:hypothetical protein
MVNMPRANVHANASPLWIYIYIYIYIYICLALPIFSRQVSFSWAKIDDGAGASTINIPVYLNNKRISLLFSIAAQLPEEEGVEEGAAMPDVLIQRGVGLVLWD